MKTIIVTAVVTLLLTGLAVMAFMYSGVYDVSASIPHGKLSNWAMSTTMNASIDRRAKNIEIPDLSDPSLALSGVNDFEAMCAGCHGAPGKSPNTLGKGLNPPAPDLQKAAAHRTPAELFWVTKQGIKMTGMPSWGASHGDAELWPVVAFMTKLPSMDEAAYLAMLQQAKGAGHHADEADSNHASDGTDHHDTNEQHPMDSEMKIETPKAKHDHSSHEH